MNNEYEFSREELDLINKYLIERYSPLSNVIAYIDVKGRAAAPLKMALESLRRKGLILSYEWEVLPEGLYYAPQKDRQTIRFRLRLTNRGSEVIGYFATLHEL